MSKKAKYCKFRIEVYQCNIHFLTGRNLPKLAKFFKKKKGIKLLGDLSEMDGCTAHFGVGNTVVLLEPSKDKTYEDSVLMHECNHAAATILSDRGYKIKANNLEPFTYLAQSIFLRCKKGIKIAK